MRVPIAALAMIALAAAGSARAEPPDKLYLLSCWGCHRAPGEGIAGTAPALRGAADFTRVAGGREYLIEVPGVANSALDDAQVAAVMNWIVASFSTGSAGRETAEFKPYTAAEVGQYRGRHLLDVKQARAKLIDAMVARGIRAPEK